MAKEQDRRPRRCGACGGEGGFYAEINGQSDTRRLVMTGRGGRWVEVNCWHCEGTGNQGGRAEPVEPPDLSAPQPPVGDHVAVAETGLCPACLGAGEVVSLQEGMRGRMPCPRCAHPPG